MEGGRDGPRFPNPNVGGEDTVEHVRPLGNWDSRGRIHVSNLAQSVRTAIGAACPYDLNVFA